MDTDKKLFYILLFLLITTTPSIGLPQNINYKILALNKQSLSLVTLKETEEKCHQQKVLPENLFNNITASNNVKKIAIRYFYLKNYTECTSNAVKEYLLASSVRMFIDENLPRELRDSDELIVSNHILFLKVEAEYDSISEENKRAFEAIQELHQPFDLIDSAKSLNLL